MIHLGESLCCQLKYAEAENILRQACSTAVETHGMTTEASVANLWLARVLHYQTKNIEASKLLAALLTMKDDVYDLADGYTETLLLFLGRSLSDQGKYREAEIEMRPVVIDQYKKRITAEKINIGGKGYNVMEAYRLYRRYESCKDDHGHAHKAQEHDEDEDVFEVSSYTHWRFCDAIYVLLEYTKVCANINPHEIEAETKTLLAWLNTLE